MNKSEINNAVTVAAALLGPYLISLGVDPGTFSNAANGVVAVAIFGYAIYSHWNLKKVPETATVKLAPQPLNLGVSK